MIIDLLRKLPAVRDVLARDNFRTIARVTVAHWEEVDDATIWLHQRWQDAGYGYRRRVDAVAQVAVFEFANETDAVEFALRFG